MMASTKVSPRGWGYGVSMGNRFYRLAVGPGREIDIRTAPLEAPRVNTASSPEEATAEFGLTFARSRFDGGEGLFRAHQEGAAPNRFWDSKNVSVVPAEPGEFPEVRLLPATERIRETVEDGLHFASRGGSLYVAEGQTVRRTDDPEAASPTWVDDDPHGGEAATDVLDLAVLGDEVYAALGANGIHVRSAAGTWSHWSDTAAVRLWAAKGRIVASSGESLYEVTDAGVAPDALKTLAPGDTWQDVVDGGSHVLAAASNGYVYAFGTDTGVLVEEGSTLFEGETPRSLGQTQGIVAVGSCGRSTGRLYVGVVLESGQLGELQLVKQWDSADVDCTPRNMVGTRSSILMGTPDPDGATYLWRYDIVTGGVSRYLSIEGMQGLVNGVTVVDGKVYASVDGAGVYRQADTYATSGYLIGPLGDFFSSQDKSWIGASLETGTIASGMKVSFYYTTDPDALADPDSSAWHRIATREAGSGDPGEIALTGVMSRSLAGMVVLEPSVGGLETPTVRSFSFRAYPSSGDNDLLVTLPINVSDQIERRGRARTRVPGRGAREYGALLSLAGKPVTLEVYFPKQTLMVRGLVEEVATPVQGVSTRGSTTMVSQVRVRGKRTFGFGITSGDGSFGTYRLFGTLPTFAEID